MERQVRTQISGSGRAANITFALLALVMIVAIGPFAWREVQSFLKGEAPPTAPQPTAVIRIVSPPAPHMQPIYSEPTQLPMVPPQDAPLPVVEAVPTYAPSLDPMPTPAPASQDVPKETEGQFTGCFGGWHYENGFQTTSQCLTGGGD